MNTIADIERRLENARSKANREGSDRLDNPDRAVRDLRQQALAHANIRNLERLLDVAAALDERNIPWTLYGQTIDIVLPNGNRHPAADGDILDEQIDLYVRDRSHTLAGSLSDALKLLTLDVSASRTFQWVRERMRGVSPRKFHKVFLRGAGILDAKERLTDLGRSLGFFHEHEGSYGIYQTASRAGVAWLYGCYLEHHVPLTQVLVSAGPVPDVELDAIAQSVHDADKQIPEYLRRLAGWSTKMPATCAAQGCGGTTQVTSWRNIRVRHPDGREGLIVQDASGFGPRTLTIKPRDGTPLTIELATIGADRGEPGWEWYCEAFDGGARWLPLSARLNLAALEGLTTAQRRLLGSLKLRPGFKNAWTYKAEPGTLAIARTLVVSDILELGIRECEGTGYASLTSRGFAIATIVGRSHPGHETAAA
ncbi:hypothetical protein [Sphingomonas sp. 3-13AW]|uniref:hypothetical protein n=1 Tax=Sphingomonas sp. 3-13AW TaxID=3050450 RepID=UPI003BB54740